MDKIISDIIASIRFYAAFPEPRGDRTEGILTGLKIALDYVKNYGKEF